VKPLLPPLVAALLATAFAGAARGTPQTPVFTARADLVVLQIQVEDRDGRPVPGLMADDFEVLEDGRRQPIAFFREQDAPATIGLIVDRSGSMHAVRDRVVAAARAFVQSSHPDDELFALAFGDDVRAVLPADAPFTSDDRTLGDALERSLTARGRTSLHDAVLQGLAYVGRGSRERQVLILVADGADNASAAAFEQVLAGVERSSTLIYAIAIADPLDRDRNSRRLGRLAHASGGELFAPRRPADIGRVMREIAHAIRSLYTVGYAPPEARRGDAFRQIQVRARVPGLGPLRVHARDGYRIDEEAR
jgi:VWFA-related protein